MGDKKAGSEQNDQLNPEGNTDAEQHCFVGCSRSASWLPSLFKACDEILPDFGLKPWHAGLYLEDEQHAEDAHVDFTQTLLQKVVKMIAVAPYGIYDLSYHREKGKKRWQMPRNVLIELGMAIALNRPTLLLWHRKNAEAGLKLPDCLAGKSFVEFGGVTTLRDPLREHLEQWRDQSSGQIWKSQDCVFIQKKYCEYRLVDPVDKQRQSQGLHCLISDGPDKDQADFRGVVEEALKPYRDVTYSYREEWPLAEGYEFLLCTLCQAVRSTQFAIHRITPHTLPETFIVIGMSTALEEQFRYKHPRILVAEELRDIPSLLHGYEFLLVKDDVRAKKGLETIAPRVIEIVREAQSDGAVKRRILQRLAEDLPNEEEVRLLQKALESVIRKDLGGHPIKERLIKAMEHRQQQYENRVSHELEEGREYEVKGNYAQARNCYARAQVILEDRPGEPVEGIDLQWYLSICQQVKRMEHVAQIESLINEQRYQEAIQGCDEVLAVIQDPILETLRQEAKAQLDQLQVIANVLAEAEQALNEGDHARAITILEQATKRYPESELIEQALKDAQAAQQQAQEKIKSLSQEADDLMSRLAFAEALEKYEAVLELDKDNEEAYFGKTQAREKNDSLQRIDAKIKQAHTELDRHAWRSVQTLYEEASKLDRDGWRKTELKRLKRALDKAEKSLGAYRTTLDERLEKGEIRWPDEMEGFVEEFRRASPGLAEFEVVAQIGERQHTFLQQHFNFLSAELSEIEKLALAGDLKECVARLRQIKHHWEPILSDNVRLAAWPGSEEPLFRAVESRVGGAFELLDSYESAARRAEDVDQTIQFAREVLSKPDGHYEAAIQRIQKHLYEGLAEDDPAYDIFRSYYASLEQLKTDLQYAWDVQRSRKVIYLNQAEGFILLEEYEQAQAALGNILPEDLTSDDQKRWEVLHQAVQVGIAITNWMKKADEAWDAGDWETAQINYQSVVENPNVSQENRYRQKAARRLDGLEEVLFLDGQVQNALAKPTCTREEVYEVGETLTRICDLGLITSDYLKKQAWALQQWRQAWYSRETLKRRAQKALSRGDWEEAAKILAELGNDLDPEVINLWAQIKNVERASQKLAKANQLLELGYEADDLWQVVRYLRRALTICQSIAQLELVTEVENEVHDMREALTEELADLKHAQEHVRAAEDAAGRRSYNLAYQKMHQAYILAISHRIIREQFEQKRNQFKTLALSQNPLLRWFKK